MGKASGFQPARHLLAMLWLCRDPVLPQAPAPASLLPPATSLTLGLSMSRYATTQG